MVGHARAIDLVYDLVQNKTPFTDNELFVLHKAVQTEVIVDVVESGGEGCCKRRCETAAGVRRFAGRTCYPTEQGHG